MTDVSGPRRVRAEIVVDEKNGAPVYEHDDDAGADLRSVVNLIVPAGGRALIPTGIRMALPDGYVALIHPRSGLAARNGITVLNTPGTIDSGYRGEINVILFNTSDEDFHVSRGDRVAQLVIQEYIRADWIVVDEISDSDRGEKGLGSTGVQ